jgi:hypothetical protein
MTRPNMATQSGLAAARDLRAAMQAKAVLAGEDAYPRVR